MVSTHWTHPPVMCHDPGMKQAKLPDGLSLCSFAYAAELAGCSLRTVTRAVHAGKLATCTPLLGRRESKRSKRLLLTDEVRTWAAAYKIMNPADRDA